MLAGCEVTEDSRKLAETRCSSCHMVPSPKDLPSEVWEKNIFPEMANYFKWSATSQYAYANKAFYNKKASFPMNDNEWNALLTYFVDNSSKEITHRENITRAKQHFFEPVLLDHLCELPSITALTIGESGQLYSASDQLVSRYSLIDSAFYSVEYKGVATQLIELASDSLYVLDAGRLGPHDLALGSLELLNFQNSALSKILSGLKRPVYSILEDSIIYISQFGHTTGLISKNSLANTKIRRVDTLLSLPGCYKMLKAQVEPDGHNELITICSQALEGVYSLSDKKDTEVKKLIAFPPHYGLSDLVMCDINGDNALDIILTNGDNADYSNVPKEYHGLRIYLNDKKGHFDLSYFYPIYGATQVQYLQLEDDGRLDLVVSAYFATSPDESILIFKNLTTKENQLNFEVYGVPEASKGRWLVMSKGDIDMDGDDDIVIGSNINGPTAVQDSTWPEKWYKESVDALLLLNKKNK